MQQKQTQKGCNTMETVKKVKTAVVGCGMISNIYLRNLKELFYIIDLVVVCDLHAEAAEEKAKTYGIEKVMTIDEAAASDEIELVVNLTGMWKEEWRNRAMPENTSLAPEWVDDKTINEVLFCREFLQTHPVISVGGAFFTKDGLVSDENLLKKQIYDKIKHHITTGLWKRVSNLVEVLRMECCVDTLPLYEDRIHMANGTLFLDGSFSEEKDFCQNRLPVAYRTDAPEPVQWLAFLSQLLYPEDIPTLQEFFGYCLIPSTRGQKMLLITGKGGEGKSRVGIVLQSLLGSNMKTGSLSKVETSPFARADLQNMLVMLDDDMKMEALKQTNYIKSIVTAELPLDLEKKGTQSYQADMRVRFLAFGNGTLQALHDRSFGFFRRQIILEAKERDPARKDNPYLAERLCEEKEGIFR